MNETPRSGGRDLFEIENARNLTAGEIASTFVPTEAFWRLLSPKNHMVLGARGSGKTVLARMLAHDHLVLMHDEKARRIVDDRAFIGVYVPMKLEWVGSLLNKPWQTEQQRDDFFRWRLNIATSLSLLWTLQSCLRTYVLDKVARRDTEERLARELAEVWLGADRGSESTLTALARTLRRLEYRRQQQLAEARASRFSPPSARTTGTEAGAEFDVDLFSPLKQGIWIATEFLPIERTAAWLLCLDEAEFLEPAHHRILNSHLRAHSENLFFKITTMPYQHHTLETTTEAHLDVGHDFEYIYIDRDPVAEDVFARDLFQRRAENSGSRYGGLSFDHLFGKSDLLDPMPGDWSRGSELRELLLSYCDDETTQRAQALLDAMDRAEGTMQYDELYATFSNTIGRKLRGTLLLRHETAQVRGHKILDVYSGAKMVERCCDGNPRRLIRVFNAMLQDTTWRPKKQASGPQISKRQQSKVLMRFSTATLEQIRSQPNVGTELYDFLKEIGRHFSRFLHDEKLSTDQYSSVKISSELFRSYRGVITRAVGLGLLYPHPTSAPRGEAPVDEGTFRLAYVLAPHFRLMPRRGRARSLSIILDSPDQPDEHKQISLRFGDEA